MSYLIVGGFILELILIVSALHNTIADMRTLRLNYNHYLDQIFTCNLFSYLEIDTYKNVPRPSASVPFLHQEIVHIKDTLVMC